MFVIEDKGGAIALMLASLLFLGTWPAVLTLLESRGRLSQHTYLLEPGRRCFTNLLAAMLIARRTGCAADGWLGVRAVDRCLSGRAMRWAGGAVDRRPERDADWGAADPVTRWLGEMGIGQPAGR